MTTLKTEGQILADVFRDVRKLTKFFLAKVRDIDPHHRFMAEGKSLNSIYWLSAHLVWAENALLNKALTDKDYDFPWMAQFGLGQNPEEVTTTITYNEIRAAMDELHDHTMTVVESLSPEELDQANYLNFTFGGANTKRAIIHHAIRHEPCHTGQIGLIAKLAGVKTI